MARLAPLAHDEMSDAQHKLHDDFLKVWKRADGGPFDAWYRAPELGRLSHRLGAYLRFETVLPADVLETAILATARYWSQGYEWATHVKNARTAGLGQEVIDAIEDRRTPAFETVEQETAYAVAHEILETRTVSQQTYEAALKTFGAAALVELASVVGWYSSLAIQMNVFDVGAADGAAFRVP